MRVLLGFVGRSGSDIIILCITELLTNLTVQEEMVGEQEIEIFVRMLRTSSLNATVLSVL